MVPGPRWKYSKLHPSGCAVDILNLIRDKARFTTADAAAMVSVDASGA